MSSIVQYIGILHPVSIKSRLCIAIYRASVASQQTNGVSHERRRALEHGQSSDLHSDAVAFDRRVVWYSIKRSVTGGSYRRNTTPCCYSTLNVVSFVHIYIVIAQSLATQYVYVDIVKVLRTHFFDDLKNTLIVVFV